MKEKELNIQDIERHLRKLGFEEKSSYLSQVCPPDTAAFPGQTIGQYLFSRVCAVNDKFHTNTEEKLLLALLGFSRNKG